MGSDVGMAHSRLPDQYVRRRYRSRLEARVGTIIVTITLSLAGTALCDVALLTLREHERAYHSQRNSGERAWSTE
jgi:hypothetical protein